MAIDNKDKKVLKSSIEREQNEVACSAECEKIKGSKNLNVPPLRFPEFTEEWKEEQLDNIATLSKGIGISKEQLSEDGEPCILYGELYTKYKSEIIKQVESKTDINGSKLKRSKANDVIIPCSGETAVDIATARCVPFDNILFGGDLNVISLHQYDGAFMSYQLNGKRKYDIARVAQGVSIVHLYGEHLKAIKTYNPTLPEQQKIAKLLSLLDDRIDTQNKIIDKLKSLIKGIDEVVFQSCSKHCKLKEFDNQITAGRDKVEEGCFPLYGSTGVIGTTATPSYHEPLVLVARVGSIGCVQFVNIPCGVSDNTIVIRCGSKAKYVYYYLQNYNFERITSGTTQPLITAKDVKHIDIPIIDSANDLKAINTLDTLNMKLELESNLYNTILKQKAFLLQQMFI
ncbi:restriction endonuclease subunit S [Bacteroides stercoris]|uniref:restriction endonuclease subunit S n=4 Tax=Bacteroidaceae TaxID=815 RepID=UPI000E4474E1|nr:restriction endonuclease subunit S [Bacteroides stercoris]RGL92495.1 restriction endonuclease subunit S [Bacteroides stercoris]